MKLNKIFMALSAMAIVGCSSEDVMDFSANQAAEDSNLIELNENFVLAGVGDESNVTRTHWEQDPETKNLVNKFLPIYNATASTALDEAADLDAQAVGLCWLGQGGAAAAGADVLTNYQFYHFGWLKKGETEADVDNCDPFSLYNGILYNEITLKAAGTKGEEVDPAKFEVFPGDKAGWEINYNSGVYKTHNKSIFGGEYIVYYPFNPDFKEVGTIPAIAKTSFDWDIATDSYESPALGEATFRYSAPVTIEGGFKAANFGLYNLSTLVRVRVSTVTGDANISDKIDQVVLYSPSGKFLKQANLAADKIVAGKKGAELYDGTEEGTKTITINFTGTAPELNVKKTTEVSAYLTVLPTTVDDLVALIHNADDETWASVSLDPITFNAGGAQVIDVTVKESDVTSDFIATDAASLATALTEAEKVATEDDPVTITVIGDIELTANLTINQDADRYITIDGGDIIVPQDVTLTLQSLKEMKSTIRVLGKDCCTGKNGGRLVVTGAVADKDATILNNITLEPTEARVADATDYDKYNPMVTYEGDAAITIAEGAEVNVLAGNVNVNRAVDHKGGTIVIGANKDKENTLMGAKVTVSATGNLSFLGTTVDNYGIIEVKKAGQFYMKNKNGTSVWTDGQTMTNHEGAKFIHNVDAVVGTAVQFMNQQGEYRCRVDKQKALDDAYVQWTACNVIEMVETKAAIEYDLVNACQHKKNGVNQYIDIEVNDSKKVTFGNDSKDDKNIQIGNLTVKTVLDINLNNTKNRQLTVNGNMTVSADTDLQEAKKVTVTGNLDIDNGATLTYAGDNKIVDGLKVNGNITVTDAKFDASADNAILIECTNFSLIKKDEAGTGASAEFGNRTKGNTNKNMTVNGTISNGKGCTFTIDPAAGANLLAWITCHKVEGEGTYAGTPTVIAPTE